jgi:hypothetical protein
VPANHQLLDLIKGVQRGGSQDDTSWAENDRATVQTWARGHAEGNAALESVDFRGWVVGHFVPEQMENRATSAVEIKWGAHQPGDAQEVWSFNKSATTMSLLIRGRDEITFPDKRVVLQKEGDYAIWEPGVPHKWRALDDCLVITIRWPSVANDIAYLTAGELEHHLQSLRT